MSERDELHKALEQANREFESVHADYVEAEQNLARMAHLWRQKRRAKDAAFSALRDALVSTPREPS